MTLELAWLHCYRLLKAKRRRYRRFTAALELDLPGLPRESEDSGPPRHQSDVLGRNTGPFSALGLVNAARPDAQSPRVGIEI